MPSKKTKKKKATPTPESLIGIARQMTTIARDLADVATRYAKSAGDLAYAVQLQGIHRQIGEVQEVIVEMAESQAGVN